MTDDAAVRAVDAVLCATDLNPYRRARIARAAVDAARPHILADAGAGYRIVDSDLAAAEKSIGERTRAIRSKQKRHSRASDGDEPK